MSGKKVNGAFEVPKPREQGDVSSGGNAGGSVAKPPSPPPFRRKETLHDGKGTPITAQRTSRSTPRKHSSGTALYVGEELTPEVAVWLMGQLTCSSINTHTRMAPNELPPGATTLVLARSQGNLDLIDEALSKGVRVFILTKSLSRRSVELKQIVSISTILSSVR